jgi:N6-L-threonylcarbamoyladenine synthase
MEHMKILGIETSCDETAASVVRDGRTVLSSIVHSQITIHAQYGGVVPEIAARSHIEVMLPVVHQALHEAHCDWSDIDAIAVTYAPGLIGSLLIGSLTARTLAITKQKPLYPIHHVKAHVYAGFLEGSEPLFPLLSLIVSGGHTQLVLFHSHEKYEIVGQTQDDAVGEAFDKVAKIIGLPYPGGPSIAEAANLGDSLKYPLPIAKLSGKYDFSFSGLKTAVLRAVQREVGVDITFPSHQLSERLSDAQRHDFAASFQKIAVDTLVKKVLMAESAYSPTQFVLAGGVAANNLLRKTLQKQLSTPVILPKFDYCTDNAAMIAGLAYYESRFSQPIDPHHLEVAPSLSM